MNKWMISTVISSALPLACLAQAPNTSFQAVFTSSGPGGTITLNNGIALKGKVVTGRPFSGTEEHHTVQVLGDGTRIENKSSDKFYRDDQGRTRIEHDNGTVLIEDPVQGASAEINGNRKVVRGYAFSQTEAERKAITVDGVKTFSYSTSSTTSGGDAAQTDKLKAEALAKMAKATAAANTEAHNEEDLGFQVINGISAQGTRTTTTIPAGQIGNDRPINVVSERWFSPDLQMLIRSSNKDPRFGETTYDLTNISQTPPDASLFQVPAK
jgi:hypothetical protein